MDQTVELFTNSIIQGAGWFFGVLCMTAILLFVACLAYWACNNISIGFDKDEN